ncbi:MAG: NYN domain-containing protein, partial [Dehalococcoidia bacterium]|nr:NYN domain-containing protein [Dehalococcoidia bacterium]
PYMEVRLGHTKLRQGVPVEKGIDIMLATDLLLYGFQRLYDVAILVSGDGDFAYALQMAKNMGKHVEVAYFERNVSKDLQDIADYAHVLNRAFFDGLWWARRTAPVRRRRPGGKPQVAIQAAQPSGQTQEIRPPEPTLPPAEFSPQPEPVRGVSPVIHLPSPTSQDIFR